MTISNSYVGISVLKIYSIYIKTIVYIKQTFNVSYIMVPDDTVNKGTSRRHKTDGKSTHFAVHFSPSIFDLKINKLSHYNHHPIKSAVGYIFKFPMLTEKPEPPFCQLFGVLVPT